MMPICGGGGRTIRQHSPHKTSGIRPSGQGLLYVQCISIDACPGDAGRGGEGVER